MGPIEILILVITGVICLVLGGVGGILLRKNVAEYKEGFKKLLTKYQTLLDSDELK